MKHVQLACPGPHITPFGLYIHVPFCRRKCHYCDFFSKPGPSDEVERYCAGLIREISWVASRLPPACQIRTLYFGGGTPSVLGLEQTDRIFGALFRHFSFVDKFEWSMEANPESFTTACCDMWSTSGVNRVSLGIQSLQESQLRALGRCHDREQAIVSIERLAAGPFASWSVDLMCGIPGQTEQSWSNDLEEIKQFGPPHISAYPLTVEPDTVLEVLCQNKWVHLPDEDRVADMLIHAETILIEAGFEHYEISNYARPGHCCQHNLAYWTRGNYIGLGPAAASFWRNVRSVARASLEDYTCDWEGQSSQVTGDPFERPNYSEIEVLDKQEQCRESIILGTRLGAGFDLGPWLATYGTCAQQLLGQVDKHVRGGLLQRSGNTITLTKHGQWIANTVWRDFLD